MARHLNHRERLLVRLLRLAFRMRRAVVSTHICFFDHEPSIVGDQIMQLIPLAGILATLVGLDASGTPSTQFPAAPTWSASAGFVVNPAADGMTAVITPADPAASASGTLTVTCGALSCSKDISYTAAASTPPAGPGPVARLDITFSPLPTSSAAPGAAGAPAA
jgi:hypothetical protein